MSVKPQRLAVLIFYSMLPNGDFDQTSLHTGCDEVKGTKWAANFWFWNQPQMSANGWSTGASLARELDDASVSRGEHAGLKIVSHGGIHHGGRPSTPSSGPGA